MDKERSEFSDLLKKDIDQRIGDLHERVDRQIATQERERAEAVIALRSKITELEKYLSSLVEGQSKRFEGALECARRETELMYTAQEKAVAKSESAADKRFESVNEFRAQLADQSASFMPREVADAQFVEVRKQLSSNTDRLNKNQGKQMGSDKQKSTTHSLVGTGLATLAVVISVLVLIFSILGHSSQGFTCVPSSAVAKTTMVCK